MITTRFYPDPVVGAVRMTQWARHLPEFGWQPIVLSRHYGYEATPEEIAVTVHPDVEVRYLNKKLKLSDSPSNLLTINQSRGFLKKYLSKLARFFPLVVPDVSIRFWRSGTVRSTIRAVVEEIKPDVVMTTSPPHSNHDIGLWLTRQYPQLPWIADFRDPYIIDSRYQPSGLACWSRPFHFRYEQQIYDRAALIIHALKVQHRFAWKHYTKAHSRLLYLPNGCPTELAEGYINPARSEAGRISIRAVGASGPYESMLMARAVAKLVDRGYNLELRLIGPKPASELSITACLGKRVILTGSIQHERALEETVGADVLICLLDAKRSRNGLSSKLFEYCAISCPIIMVNPTRSDQYFLSGRSGIALLKNPKESDLSQAIIWALSNDALPSESEVNLFKEKYNRRRQVKFLSNSLNKISGF